MSDSYSIKIAYQIILDRNSKLLYFIYMLKLSTKGQYGVRAMYEIAKGYDNGPITIKEISKKQAVSIPYLEQILNKLRRANIIISIIMLSIYIDLRNENLHR